MQFLSIEFNRVRYIICLLFDEWPDIWGTCWREKNYKKNHIK